MLVMFNHRPIMTLLTSPDHVTVGSGTPDALQYKDTLPSSTTGTLVIGCTDAETENYIKNNQVNKLMNNS